MRVLTKGGNANVNAGIITATAAGDTTVTALIRIGQGQTQMAIYGVPSTQKLYIYKLGATANKAGGAAGLLDASLCANPEPADEETAFLVKHTWGLQTVGSSSSVVDFRPPKIIAGPAIVKVQVASGAANMDVSAWFDGIVVDN